MGPAIATLLVSLGLGAFILHYSANELHASIHDLFDCKFLMKFTVECIGGVLIFTTVRYWLRTMEMYYLGVFIITCGGYILCVGLPNLKRYDRHKTNFFTKVIKNINAFVKSLQ